MIAAPALAAGRTAAARAGTRPPRPAAIARCSPCRSRRRATRPAASSSSSSTEERVFTEDDLELARHLADATRGALERSELFEAERTARALAQQLARTGRLLTTELDPAAVLDEVVQQAPELVHADACAIRVLEDDELVVNAAVGPGSDAALGSRSSASAWLSGDVVQSRAPVALENAGADARLRELDPMLAAGNAAYLGVPLAGPEGAPLGVLAVYCAGAAAVARGGGRGDARARSEHVGRALERGAVSARRAGEGAQLRDPRQHRRRHRRRRPRRAGRSLERGGREDHGRSRRRMRSGVRRRTSCSARSSRGATRRSATGSSR